MYWNEAMARKRRNTKPHEKLAASLAKLKELQTDGRRVFQSDEFARVCIASGS